MSPATGRVLGAVFATIWLASAAQGMRLGEPPAGEEGIYWTEWESIHRSNLDGSNVEDLVKSRLRVPYDIALDPAGGKIYWTELYWDSRPGTIQRADLDGSNPELLVTGLSAPWDIALDVTGGKVYWTEPGDESGAISRANLDGTHIEVLVTGPEESRRHRPRSGRGQNLLVGVRLGFAQWIDPAGSPGRFKPRSPSR